MHLTERPPYSDHLTERGHLTARPPYRDATLFCFAFPTAHGLRLTPVCCPIRTLAVARRGLLLVGAIVACVFWAEEWSDGAWYAYFLVVVFSILLLAGAYFWIDSIRNRNHRLKHGGPRRRTEVVTVEHGPAYVQPGYVPQSPALSPGYCAAMPATLQPQYSRDTYNVHNQFNQQQHHSHYTGQQPGGVVPSAPPPPQNIVVHVTVPEIAPGIAKVPDSAKQKKQYRQGQSTSNDNNRPAFSSTGFSFSANLELRCGLLSVPAPGVPGVPNQNTSRIQY